MLKSFTIHKKLLFINTTTLLLAFILVGLIWLVSAYFERKEFLYQRITSQGTLVSSNISAAILFDDEESARTILSALSSDKAIISARVMGSKANDNFSLQFQNDTSKSARLDITNIINHVDTMVFPITESEMKIGSIELTFSYYELFESLGAVAAIVLLTATFAVFVGLILANRLQKIVTVPIAHLLDVTRRVSKTNNYAYRCDVYYPDELGELSDGLNSMLAIIEERDSYLELNIDKRTKELKGKNLQLNDQIEKRKQSEQARKEVEAIFEQAFINAPIGMALIGKSEDVIRYNQVFSELLDISTREGFTLHRIILPEYQDEVTHQFSLLKNGDNSRFELHVKCNGQKGEIVIAIVRFSAIHNIDGSFRHAVLQIQDITESTRLANELEHQAKHDALTGLANRRVLDQALHNIGKEDRNYQKPHTLCYMDLDQFKVVNDTCGHIGGDELLRQVSETIREQTRENDLVVRMGGDEFAILLYHCERNEASNVTENIRQAIENIFFQWEENSFRISASIGAVVCDPNNFNVDTIMQQVDAACYEAKESGRNRVHIITSESSPGNQRKKESQWVHRLRQAIDEDLFILFSQPIISLSDDEQFSNVEVLLRLMSDEGTILAPGAFLPAAERYGLMTNIDRWVVGHLIENLTQDRQAYDGTTAYWINLSGMSLSDENFLVYLEDIIKQANLPPNVLNFEITETYFVSNMHIAKNLIQRLRALGCRFSLDDFGSGMSSFGYLKQLPIDWIKIDGMFVRDMFDDDVNMIFVKNIIEIAQAMGKKTVAEYVENQEILSKVKEFGVSYAQGYTLGRPEQLFSEPSSITLAS